MKLVEHVMRALEVSSTTEVGCDDDGSEVVQGNLAFIFDLRIPVNVSLTAQDGR
jgi:hypothetical protein